MKRLSIFYVLPVFALLAFSYDIEPESKEIKKAIALGDVKILKTEIDFPVGDIHISSSSGDAVKGIYKFYKYQWEPEINYERENQVGYLEIESREKRRIRKYDDCDQSKWHISFPKRMLHDLE